MTKKSTAFDSAATATCKQDAKDMTSLQVGNTILSMANGARTTIKLTGSASLVCETHDGSLRRLCTGKTLVGSSLHDLLSPSAMFSDPSSELDYVRLERESSALVLFDGTRIPLRWDGRLFWLDYWSGDTDCKTARAAEECDTLTATCAQVCEHVQQAPAQDSEVACAGKHFRQLNRDAMNSIGMPTRVVEPYGMSNTGLQHRKMIHSSTALINATRALDGLPPLRAPPPGHRCAVCEISNARTKNIKRSAMPPQPIGKDGQCDCSVCAHNSRHLPALGALEDGDEVSGDLGGPIDTPTLDGSKYFVVWSARRSRHIIPDSMKQKSGVLDCLKRYVQNHGKMKVLHTDGGGEFLGKFSAWCREQGIRQTFNCPYSSFENSHAESAVGFCKRAGRRVHLESGLPDAFWFRSMHTACVIRNQMVSSVNSSSTPLWDHFGDTRKPVEPIVMGSLAYTLIVPKQARKQPLKYPAFAGIFVGYSDTSNAYLIYDQATGTVKPRRDCVFDEWWRWRAAEPTADVLTIPITHDGASPVPVDWRYPPRTRTNGPRPIVKTESPSITGSPGATDQGGLTGQHVPCTTGASGQGGHLPKVDAPTPASDADAPAVTALNGPSGGPSGPPSDAQQTPVPNQGGLPAARPQPVDDITMPTPQVSTALPVDRCSHGWTCACPSGCHVDEPLCIHTVPAGRCTQCATCSHGFQRTTCVECSPPDVYDSTAPLVPEPKPKSGAGQRDAQKARKKAASGHPLPIDAIMLDTGKASTPAGGRPVNTAIADRVKAMHGKCFIEAARDGMTYTTNQGKIEKYARKDFKYDVDNGYLEARPGLESINLSVALALARATGLSLDEYVNECILDADIEEANAAASDAETEEADQDTAPDKPPQKKGARHVTLCSGTFSHMTSVATADPTAEGLCIDIMRHHSADAHLKKLDHDVRKRIKYVQLDCRHLTYRMFSNLVRDHLGCSVAQLSSVHFSPPCTSYSTAHHGKNPHRKKLKPITKLAHDHDRLIDSVLSILKQVGRDSYRTTISVENPLSNFRHMPKVQNLLRTPGWFERTGDHCMNRRKNEPCFPRKRSTWLLFNVSTNVQIRKCDGTCGCVLDGMPTHHKMLVCNRSDKMRGQHVMTCPVEMGRIPLGTWDILHGARTRSIRVRRNTHQGRPTPEAPQNEPLCNTNTARDPEVRARCEMVHGYTYLQACGKEYTSENGAPVKYGVQQLLDDLKNGYLVLQAEAAFEASLDLPDGKQKQKAIAEFLNDYFESASLMEDGADPLNEKEADASPEAGEWVASRWEEIKGLLDLNCWTYRPKTDKHNNAAERNKKLYKGKFVFKTKSAANGQVKRRKSRYVISDPKFLQKMTDVDCFSPMCRYETVRWLLSVAVERDWDILSTDIKNAFPTAKLPEPVWMEIPKFILNEKDDDGNLKHPELQDCYAFVTGALYGLANSPRCFNKHLDRWFKDHGYEPLDADSCLYVKYDEKGAVRAAAATFVDDALIAGDTASLNEYRQMLKNDYTISDNGMPSDFLGMQIERDRQAGTLKLFQSKYIEKMASRYDVALPEGKRAPPVPMSYTCKLEPAEAGEERCESTVFRSIVGALQFASICCRPDIAQSIKELAKHLIDPSMKHYRAARQVVTYLLLTKNVGLTYTKHAVRGIHGNWIKAGVVEGFTDASFAECMLTRKSTSGYVIMRCGAAISWGARSQGKVAYSTSDSELRAMAEATRETLWVRKLENAFSNPTELTKPAQDGRPAQWTRAKPAATKLWEDNKCVIKWVANPCAHSRVKHIDVPLKAIREEIQEFYNLDVEYIDTQRQLADVMTKNLAPAVHWRLVAPIMNMPIPTDLSHLVEKFIEKFEIADCTYELEGE